eukprot:10486893-Ditylum_brightwellii.AAC.1
MMGKDEFGTSINAIPQPRKLAVSPETCCKITNDVSIGSSICHHNGTVDMLQMFSSNACKSDWKDVKLFHCVDDWE